MADACERGGVRPTIGNAAVGIKKALDGGDHAFAFVTTDRGEHIIGGNVELVLHCVHAVKHARLVLRSVHDDASEIRFLISLPTK